MSYEESFEWKGGQGTCELVNNHLDSLYRKRIEEVKSGATSYPASLTFIQVKILRRSP